MKKGLLLLFIGLVCYSMYAEKSYMGKESFNWYFGGNAGISFNTPDLSPVVLTDSQIFTLEGCATTSDSMGNLLFYTDGFYVYNKNHEIMHNSDHLNGNFSSTQSAIIVQWPGKEHLYYIFTVDYQIGVNGFCYSIVDMTKDDSSGSVIDKNNLLLPEVTEKLTATQHANGVDIWVIVHGWDDNRFYAYKITESGLQLTPVISEVGMVHTGGRISQQKNENKVGYMRVSPSGAKLACAIRSMQTIQIFDFDNETGKLSDPLELTDQKFEHPYGLEFSIDSRFLYVSKLTPKDRLYQIDLDFDSEQGLIDNAIMVDNDHGDYLGGIQTGPDGKVYVAQSNSNYIGAINNPTMKGTDCDFISNALYLNEGICNQGLPNFTQLSFVSSISIIGDNSYCEGDTLHLKAEIATPHDVESYIWKFNGELISTKDELIIPSVSIENAGSYSLEVRGPNLKLFKVLRIEINEKSNAEILGETVVLQGETIKLSVDPYFDEYLYHWSTGETGADIEISEPGQYSVIIETDKGCIDTAYHSVDLLQYMDVEIAGPEYLCEGSTVQLYAMPEGEEFSYLWSTGETTQHILVSEPSIYSVAVTSKLGFFGEATKDLPEAESPKAEIISDKKIEFCEGESAVLRGYYQEGYDLMWSTGDHGNETTVTESGKYILTVQNEFGCINADTVEVTMHPNPIVNIISDNDTVLCSNQSITLTVEEFYPEYSWSSGHTTKEIEDTEPGVYSVTVHNEYGCSESDSIKIISPDYNIAFTEFDQSGAIDFGRIERLQHAEKNIRMTNLSGHSIYVNSVKAMQNEENVFSVASVNFPAKLEIGETMEITIGFNPNNIGQYNAELLIDVTEPCDYQVSKPISGLSAIKTIVWLPDTTGIIGDSDYKIPLKAKLETSDEFSILMSYRAEINYLADMYMPVNINIGTFYDSYLDEDRRVLVIEGEDIIVSNRETTLAEIEGIILLGDQNETPLIISDFAYHSEFIDFTTINGRLRIGGMCFQDGSRVTLVKMLEAVISPNPGTGSVRIALNNCVEGNYEIKIFNLQGEIIKKIQWTNGTDDTKLLELDLTGTPTGVYRVSITGPFQQITYPITIVH